MGRKPYPPNHPRYKGKKPPVSSTPSPTNAPASVAGTTGTAFSGAPKLFSPVTTEENLRPDTLKTSEVVADHGKPEKERGGYKKKAEREAEAVEHEKVIRLSRSFEKAMVRTGDMIIKKWGKDKTLMSVEEREWWGESVREVAEEFLPMIMKYGSLIGLGAAIGCIFVPRFIGEEIEQTTKGEEVIK